MSTVLVHNTSYTPERWASRGPVTADDVRSWHWWNLWRIRQAPYEAIADGIPVLLLNTGPGGVGELSWHVVASEVRTALFPDKAAAIRAIAKWAGQTPAWVRDNKYSAGRPADAGVVIYWRADPIRRLDLPRPTGLAVRRNGWAVTDTAKLAMLGIRLDGVPTRRAGGITRRRPPARGGQGRRIDEAMKKAIEEHAVAVAKLWCEEQHWTDVRETGKKRPWDLQGVDRKGVTRYVEVKGTTRGLAKVEVTAGEVESAHAHGAAHVMLIVHGIRVDASNPTAPIASNGTRTVFDPWMPRREELVEARYTWAPAADR